MQEDDRVADVVPGAVGIGLPPCHVGQDVAAEGMSPNPRVLEPDALPPIEAKP